MNNKLLIILSITTGLYMVGAFIEWDINPSKWDMSLRAVLGIIGFVGSFITINEKKDED